MVRLATLALLLLALVTSPRAQAAGFQRALRGAERALEVGNLDQARAEAMRALERDPRSVEAWGLFARWAEAAADADRRVWALHRQLANATAQGLRKERLAALVATLETVDPIAADALDLARTFVKKLVPLAEKYEKEGRPHSAIRVHKQILAIDPARLDSERAIERIASAPDPSLAADAKAKDLLADVSVEWIAEHDAAHGDWSVKAKLERDNYTTYTDAGYEVLVRAAEAMEQMNAFYREFFQFGTEEHGGSVPRIDLNIFRDRDEYLELGQGPPVEWSAGHFTGGAVETYLGAGGFEGMTGTLFHEAAHQFVSLATSAVGWLNEGLASFFEGCRILPNGTVLMNLPANHRLFPLVRRMERGWMSGPGDGIDPENAAESSPEKAPTFRIVLENKYAWGPPWYAPTWGVVYFLYNYQDPGDGRFVYRAAFREFIDKSGGRSGEGAVENFVETVLGNPAPPTKGWKPERGAPAVALPETVEELDEVWKTWLTRLSDEVTGKLEVERPYLAWAGYALERGALADAKEHFEKGVEAHPDDVELLEAFADFLTDRGNSDRAAKLLLAAARAAEALEPPDEKRVESLERKLTRLDPRQKTLAGVRTDLLATAKSLVQRYLTESFDHQAMELAWRFGNDFESPELFDLFEVALERAQSSIAIWKLAYNEENLDGWDPSAKEIFTASGEIIEVAFEEYRPEDFQYRFLTLNELTEGDFSMELELVAEPSAVSFAGIVFGRKSDTDFHAALVTPPQATADGGSRRGFVDMASFYGGDSTYKTWIHSPIVDEERTNASRSETWRKLRVDVTGATVDIWLDDEFIATHEFPSTDVVRGRFGLITGVGRSKYKNVRYLARASRDPGSLLERGLRLRRAAPEGTSKNGSWLGQVPPFPTVAEWVQGTAASWEEAGTAPTLFVMWSVNQNDYIPLDPWLRMLAETYEPVGLRIVSVLNGWDAAKAEAYLEEHEFPGVVGVDVIPPGQRSGVGTTFGAYAIDRFQLPRLILLDVDGKVVWEGDPGFKGGVGYNPEEESYLAAPLRDLVERRRLNDVAKWREAWQTSGRPALEAGDLATALPLLLEAEEYDLKRFPAVLEARTRVQSVRAALAAIETLAAEWDDAGRGPAIDALLAWGELLELPADRQLEKALKRFQGGASDWKRALGILTPLRKQLEAGKAPDDASSQIERLASVDGKFAADLAARLAAANGDAERLAAVVNEAERLPWRWLATEHFGWGAER